MADIIFLDKCSGSVSLNSICQFIRHRQLIIAAAFIVGFLFNHAINMQNQAAHEDKADDIIVLKRIKEEVKRFNKKISVPFSALKVPEEVQSLKGTVRERTKNLTGHIQRYCKARHPLTGGAHLYFDFMHSFLYCQTNKVSISLLI